MRYRPHKILVAPAQSRPELWRLAAALATVAVLTDITTVAMAGALPDSVFNLWPVGDDGPATGGRVAGLVLLVSFALVIGALAAALRLFYDRDLLSLIGPWPLLVVDGIGVLRATLILTAVLLVLPPWGWTELLWQRSALPVWLLLLPFSLLALLVQVSAEELVFCGFFQQQLAAAIPHPVVWLTVPSAVFAMLHYDPETFGPNAGLVTLWAFLFGVALADLTARSGSLGPAIALHFVNNLTPMLLVSAPGTFSGLALFVMETDPANPEGFAAQMVLELFILALMWLAARVAIRR